MEMWNNWKLKSTQSYYTLKNVFFIANYLGTFMKVYRTNILYKKIISTQIYKHNCSTTHNKSNTCTAHMSFILYDAKMSPNLIQYGRQVWKFAQDICIT